MSIHSLMQEEARRSVDKPAPPLKGPGGPVSGDASIASTLAMYVPAEALAVYTSALAFLVPDDQALEVQSYGSRWALAGVVLVLAVLYALGTYRRELRRMGRGFTFPWQKTIVVVAAFAAWVCVVPGSPFNSFSWYSPAVGAAIGLVVNALIGAFALFVDEPLSGG